MQTSKQAHAAALDALRAKLKERFKNVRKLEHTEAERAEYLRSRPLPSCSVQPHVPPTEQELKEREEYIKLHNLPF
jgi:hypothetical protein